ncbi:signal peptidase I [Paenibacillus chartarius]|uniref:Signal peptidase I n=1 Tax=Paenibacillus chartarius TaxID=747481 RepID=A0ABV6DSF7_9BACL
MNEEGGGRRRGGSIDDSDGRGFLAEVWDWMKATVVALILVLLIHEFGFNFSTVRGQSMRPTLEEGEWLFVNKTIAWLGSPQPGDIVILKEPEQAGGGMGSEHPYLVKRVIGVAGDKVEIRGAKLYINGIEKSEPYIDVTAEDGDYGPTVVEPGHVFVMGDNRHRYASQDSRSFGTVPLKLVQGRAEFILWPFAKKGWL